MREVDLKYHQNKFKLTIICRFLLLIVIVVIYLVAVDIWILILLFVFCKNSSEKQNRQ